MKLGATQTLPQRIAQSLGLGDRMPFLKFCCPFCFPSPPEETHYVRINPKGRRVEKERFPPESFYKPFHPEFVIPRKADKDTDSTDGLLPPDGVLPPDQELEFKFDEVFVQPEAKFVHPEMRFEEVFVQPGMGPLMGAGGLVKGGSGSDGNIAMRKLSIRNQEECELQSGTVFFNLIFLPSIHFNL